MVGNIKYERQERGVLNPEEVGSFLAFLGERTKRIKAEAQDAAPIKKGAKESRRSLDALQAVRDEALIAVLFCSGMRAGELRALRWSSVDLKTGRCKIIEADKGKDGIGKPKWGKTRRSSSPSLPWTAQDLEGQPALRGPGDYFVFGTAWARTWLRGAPQCSRGLHQGGEGGEGHPGRRPLGLAPRRPAHPQHQLLAAGVAPLLVQSFLAGPAPRRGSSRGCRPSTPTSSCFGSTTLRRRWT